MSIAAKVSFYKSAKDVAPSKEITISELVRIIRDEDHSEAVACVRSAATEDEKRIAKMKLPVVQISGCVTEGNRAKAFAEDRFEHSGWLQLDIDGGGLNGMTPEEARGILGADPHVLSAFITPSGNGAKGLFKIKPCQSDAEHKAAFLAVEKHIYEKYGFNIDPSTKDSGRLCFLPADADCTWNEATLEFVPPMVVPIVAVPFLELPRYESLPSSRINRPKVFPEPPTNGIHAWLMEAAWHCRLQEGMAEAETVSKLQSYDGTLRRPLHPTEAVDAVRAVFAGPLTTDKGKGTTPPAPFPLFRADEIGGVAAPSDFVEGLLTEGGVSMLYGPSNCGKSFWILDLASCVATGRKFRDELEVDQGTVVYVALEGLHGIRNRIEVLKSTDRLPQGAPLFVCFAQVSLLEEGDPQRLAESVKQAAAHSNLPCRLVIIDTLSRAMAGGDENTAPDMTRAIAGIDAIKAATGAHVCVVHHRGKDETRGARGHSSLRAAIDSEFEVTRRMCDDFSIVTATKQRDLSTGEPMPFSLEEIAIGTNLRGKPISSCVVSHLSSSVAEKSGKPGKAGRKPTHSGEDLLDLLPEETVTAWGKRAKDELGMSQSTFYELKKKLEANGRIERVEGKNKGRITKALDPPMFSPVSSLSD